MAFGIVKFFKKIVKGVSKRIKKVVKGVKKVWKKISKSKILKAIAIAAAVIVTGGAAIGAFGGSLATSTFGTWMINAGNAITGFTLGGTATAGAAAGTTTAFGTTAATTATGLGGLTTGVTGGLKVGSLLKPFASAGKFLGSTAGKATDFLNLTDPVTRGVQAPAALPGAAPSRTYTPTYDPVTGAKTGLRETTAAAPTTPDPNATNWGQFALKTGIQTGAGMLAGYVGQGDPTGEMAGLANEGKEYQDALQIFAAQQGIDVNNIYNTLAFGTGDPGYAVSSTLFSQQAYQPVGQQAYQPVV